MVRRSLIYPAGKHNRHWTRNIIGSQDKKKIYVAVGSGSNIAEHGIENEILRANILEMDPDGSNERVYAAGLRNPVGMAWAPRTKTLWTVVNERDELGDDLVPDYLTSVREGGFYGWPYNYYGKHEDPRVKEPKPEAVSEAIVPDVQLGAHTASLGLVFYTNDAFPESIATVHSSHNTDHGIVLRCLDIKLCSFHLLTGNLQVHRKISSPDSLQTSKRKGPWSSRWISRNARRIAFDCRRREWCNLEGNGRQVILLEI